jgi:hypothetical protein
MKPASCVAAGILIAAVSITLSGTPIAHAQSVKGEASSHGIAGGDSFGSEGSARGGNGPSETGFVASGGVAGNSNRLDFRIGQSRHRRRCRAY